MTAKIIVGPGVLHRRLCGFRIAAAPSAQRSMPKRARPESSMTPAVNPQPSEPASKSEAQPDEQLIEVQRTITTVTNRSHDHERKRIKDHGSALVERRLDVGLVAPDMNQQTTNTGPTLRYQSKIEP